MADWVHVIDDDAAVRDSLAFLLETADLLVRTYASAVEFLDAVPTMPHGCIVTDVRMPEMSGVDLAHRLKNLGVPDPVIVITGHADVPLAVEAMKAGVADFIEKPFDDEVILAAIRTALERGGKDIEGAAERARIAERIAALSGREKEVLDGLVAGHANKVIAYELGISPRTVESHLTTIFRKLGVRNRRELQARALEDPGLQP